MKPNFFYSVLLIFIIFPLIESQRCRVPTCDIVFLVDGTSAVGNSNFQRIKDYLRSFLKRFTISLDATHVGLVQFTPMARPEFYFKHHFEPERVDQAIGSMAYAPCEVNSNCYGSDDLNMSLPYAAELALAEGGGNRAGYPDVIVIVTTGHQNPRSNSSVLNSFRPVSPRLIYVVEVGDVPQFTRVPGADVITVFRVNNFDQIGSSEDSLCNAVRDGVAGIVIGPDGSGSVSGSGTGTGTGSGTGTGGSGNGNNPGSGSGNSGGSGTGTGGSNSGTNGQNSGGANGTNGGSGTGTGGSGSSGTGSGSGTGTGNSGGSGGIGGSGTNGNGTGTGSSGSGSGTGTGTGGTGTGGSSGSGSGTGTGTGSGQGSGSGQGAQADAANGGNGNSATSATVAGAAIGGGTTLGILILFIVLAVIGFLILAYCLYRNRQENKKLIAKIQEMRNASEMERGARGAGMAKAVQVVRGTTADGMSLSNIRLMHRNGGDNIDYFRVNNDRQRLLDGRNGSEDPNFINGQDPRIQVSNAMLRDHPLRTDKTSELNQPIGTYWLPSHGITEGTNRAGTATLAPGDRRELERMNHIKQRNEAEAELAKEIAAEQKAINETEAAAGTSHHHKNGLENSRRNSNGVQGQFRRKRSAEMDEQNRRNSLSDLPSRKSEFSLTGTFKRKQLSHSNSLEGPGRTRHKTHIPVRKLSPRPPPLPNIDLLFVVDNSGSIGNGNFERVKTFLRLVTERINVSAEGNRIGCIMFNQEPSLMFGFDKYLSTPYVLGALERLTYMGGGTYSGRALRFAAEVLNLKPIPSNPLAKKPPRYQKIHFDPQRIKVLIFVSDGVTEDHIEEASEDLRTSGVQIAAVSVKNHQQDALVLITRDPDSIFNLDDQPRVSHWIEQRQKAAHIAVHQIAVPVLPVEEL